jgi:transcription elongation factor Elf1
MTPREDAMGDFVTEHRFPCPYCGELISMLFDLTVPDQSYVEDCEVCCNPIALRVRSRNGMVVALEASELT